MADGDGVVDEWDKEPNTPPGSYVNRNGRALRDSDSDGVPDLWDKETNTPLNSCVDRYGRGVDSPEAKVVKELELVKKWHVYDGIKVWQEYTVYRRDGKEIKHGTYKGWHESGQKLIQGEFKDGKECDTWTLWHENGQMHLRGKFKDGKRCGTWTEWRPSGRVHDKINYGPCP